jgi:hypothetical protein
MTRKLFLHIGYPKTGTTALQTEIFPSLREHGFYYAGNDEPTCASTARSFAASVHNPESDFTLPVTEAENFLISCESITADCLKYIDNAGKFTPHDPAGLAARCRQAGTVFNPDNIRIIVTLRKQGELSHSLYAQSYTHFFSRDPAMMQFSQYAARLLAGSGIAAAYDFHAITQELVKEFGRSNVLVLFHEDMVADPGRYLDELSGFIGQPLPAELPAVNVRLGSNGRHTQTSSLYEEFAMLAKKHLPPTWSGLGRHLGFLRRIPARNSQVIEHDLTLESQITRAFSSTNRALGLLLERDLSEIGYY